MAKTTLTISSKNYSSWSLRGWLLAKFSGLEFEEVVTAPDDASARAEILLLSSSILVPCLRHDGATVWDTLAIAAYLNEIKPDAGLVPQLAALFHDADRLASDPQERIEHRAHRALDDAQAKEGGERAASVLRGAGVADEDALRVRDLVAGRLQGEPDAALLDDADGLSFLSLLSPRYADYFGLAQTRRKATLLSPTGK